MQNDIINATTSKESAEPLKYDKRIGSTVYRVTAHYSRTSSDTIEDKLIRMMESEVRESA